MSEAKIGTEMAIRSLVQVALMLGYSQMVHKIGTLRIYKVLDILYDLLRMFDRKS
jgi:hypothetical protein